jgi:hypothetical protein
MRRPGPGPLPGEDGRAGPGCGVRAREAPLEGALFISAGADALPGAAWMTRGTGILPMSRPSGKKPEPWARQAATGSQLVKSEQRDRWSGL